LPSEASHQNERHREVADRLGALLNVTTDEELQSANVVEMAPH
jgi:hypothetical protein